MKDLFSTAMVVLPGVALTVVCWGMYGPVLHKGQEQITGGGPPSLETRLKPLICVGLAYLVVAIIVPGMVLASQGRLGSPWTGAGITWSMAAGCAGALGALGIILALNAGGKPHIVMPIVFGAAPIVTVIVTVLLSPQLSLRDLNVAFLAGIVLVGVGASLIMANQPRARPAAEVPRAAAEARGEERSASNVSPRQS